MKGASDYFDKDLSTAMIYGLSGYGYMINIHKDLCPSGPYVWNRERYYALLRDQGVDYQRTYSLDKSSSAGEGPGGKATATGGTGKSGRKAGK